MRVSLADKRRIAGHLAAQLLAVPWNAAALTETALEFCGAKRTLAQVRRCQDIVADVLSLPRETPPSPQTLVKMLTWHRHFDVAARKLLSAPWLSKPPLTPARFQPAERFAALNVPQLATPGDLALWLRLSVEELEWFSGVRRPHDQTMIPALQHYGYIFMPKKVGAPRLIECPKPRLKTMQRRILDEMLAGVPVHAASHGFVRGRSALTGAQVHAGEAMVVAADLVDFFPSTPLRRVHGVFRSLGYPWAVARMLTGLVSTATPEVVFARRPKSEGHSFAKRKLYAARHLPQGAPTSPALANLCAFGLDVRLAGLSGAIGAHYTRYADDLTFSGDAAFAALSERVLLTVARIVEGEGYRLNASKTRVMPAHQRQTVTGVVVNAHVNIARDDFDALKAMLHNCVRHGAAAQNRMGVSDFRAHVDGRVHWVEQVSPLRGAKLRRLFERVVW